MISEDFKVERKEMAEFEVLPENVYQVEILDVNSGERPTYDTRNKPDSEKEYEKVFKFQYTLLGGKDRDGNSLRGRSVWANFVPATLYISSKNGKNELYQVIEAVIGRNLTPEEEVRMDGSFINRLIGKQIRIGIKNKPSKKDANKIFSNIETYYSADDQMAGLTDEERAKAAVKNDKSEPRSEKAEAPSENIDFPTEDINPADIPF